MLYGSWKSQHSGKRKEKDHLDTVYLVVSYPNNCSVLKQDYLTERDSLIQLLYYWRLVLIVSFFRFVDFCL